MLGAERKACLGMRQLEEVVLDVLSEAQGNGERPGVVEVSRARAGISGGKDDKGKGEPGSVAHSIRRSPGVVEISRRGVYSAGKAMPARGEPGGVARSIRRMPGRGRDQQTGGGMERERRCRQGRARQHGALDGGCPGVVEISRAGMFGGKGGAGEGRARQHGALDGGCPGVVEIGRRAGIFGGRGDASEGERRGVAHSIRGTPGRGRVQPGGDIRRERRCRQGRARRRGAFDTANARAWSRSAGGRGSSAGKAMRARASPAAWRTRYGGCPGVVEVSRAGARVWCPR